VRFNALLCGAAACCSAAAALQIWQIVIFGPNFWDFDAGLFANQGEI
jgi:hypothetical protein